MPTTVTPLNRQALVDAIQAGQSFAFRPFYDAKPEADGRLSDGCFSQWWPAPFVVAGVTYPTAEHFMMAEKARLFGDGSALERIQNAASPAEAKALGRTVRGFDQDAWAARRFDIVTAGSVHKFSATADLQAYLLSTGEDVLVEASPKDRIWGIGLGVSDPLVRTPSAWRGLNLLGFALMRARDILRSPRAA